MISRVIKKTVDLDAVQKVDQLEGPLYQLEESGHTFEITCMSGGAAAAVSGTVSGRFLRADETTVYFTGTLSGNVASITLPQSCYNVNGRFGLVVFISGNDVTSAIYAVAGNVYRSTSDTIIDPTGEIPSLEELMAQIEACEEATASAQQAASFVNSIIAPTYSTGVSYAIGDYCTYEGSLYRATAATSGEFDPSDWEMVLVGGEFKRVDGEVSGLKSASAAHEVEINGNNLMGAAGYKVRNGGTAKDPLFTLSNGTFSIVRSSSAVGNAVRIYAAVPQTLTDNKMIVHITINSNRTYQDIMTISGYSDAPSAYNDTSAQVEMYKSIPVAANIEYDQTFPIEITNDEVKYIIFYINVTSSQTTPITGMIELWPVDEVGLVKSVGALQDETAALESRVDSIESRLGAEFVIPAKIKMVGGIEYNVYHQNIIRGFNTQTAYQINTTKDLTDFIGFSRLSPSASTSKSNQGFKFRLYPYNSAYYISSGTVEYDIVPSTAGTGLTKTVLLIGDSLTFNQPLTKHLVDDLLQNDAMSVSLIGTLGTAPYLREGRAGWSATDYVHKASVDGVSNAFYNPSTETFDFSYYMQQAGFSGVDYVFVNLGTNLSSDGMDVTVADMINDLETMVSSIHAYNANIRIGVWTPPPRGIMGQGFLDKNDATLARVKAIIAAFDGKQSEKTYIVPVTLNVDPYHDFPFESVNVSRRNTAFQMDVATDRTHPSDAGYFKMADVIYGYIKYFGSLDA